jgi:type I restriction enzyme, S subunit
VSWETVKLRELTTLISSGATPKGGSDNYMPTGPVMFIRSQNVQMNHLSLEDVAYISEETHHAMKRSWVKEGDVLLNITGASIGRVAPFGLSDVVSNVNQHVCIIRPKPKLLHTRFLSYFLSTPYFQNHINEMQHGGTRQALTFSQIADFNIPLPPLAEQQRIAAILDKADALRAKRRTAVGKLDTLLQSTFLHMFGDPVINPMGWPTVSLDTVCNQITDGVHKTPKYQGSGVPFISTIHVSREGINWNESKYISREEHLQLIKRCNPQKGDVLYTKVGSVGLAVPVVEEREFSIFVQLALLKPKAPLIDQRFLTVQLNMPSVYHGVISRLTGATMKYIGIGAIGKIQIILPPFNKQVDFRLLVEKLGKEKEMLNASLCQLDNLFHSLQQRAFKGEL